MAHAPGRSILPPFTRRGPPTEEEERERLRKARQAEERRRAAELPPARSIPRTPFDPAHPTINPPGGRDPKARHPSINPPRGAPGPRTQAELTEADEARKRARAQQRGLDEQNRLDRNRRLREAGLPEEELPSERAARGVAIKRDRMRREAERREGLGLPPLDERGASIRHEAARIAVLEGDLTPIPRLIGSPESVARKARANPTLFRDQEIFRSTVAGQETFQRYNAGPGNFTRMRFDPVTNDFVVDLSTPERLSDADIKEAFGDLKTNIRDRIKGASPDEAGDLNSLLARVDAIEGFAASLTPSEIAKLIESTSDDVNRLTKPKEPLPPTIERLVADGVHNNPDGSMFITGDIKHIPKPKEEKREAVPTSLDEFIRTEKGLKVYLDTFDDVFNTMTKIADAQLKVLNDAAQAAFKAGETEKFVPQTPTPISVNDAIARTREILDSLFPEQETTTTEQPQQRSGAFPASENEAETEGFGRRFTDQDFSDMAEETGLTEEEIRAIAGQ